MYLTCFNNYVITQYIPAVPWAPEATYSSATTVAPRGEPFYPGVSAAQGEPAPVVPVVPGRHYQVHQQVLHHRICFCNTVINI